MEGQGKDLVCNEPKLNRTFFQPTVEVVEPVFFIYITSVMTNKTSCDGIKMLNCTFAEVSKIRGDTRKQWL